MQTDDIYQLIEHDLEEILKVGEIAQQTAIAELSEQTKLLNDAHDPTQEINAK